MNNFEVHLTLGGFADKDTDRLAVVGESVGLKPTFIVLSNGKLAEQPQLTFNHKGTVDTVKQEILDKEVTLFGEGYQVIRAKIEVPIDSDLIPDTPLPYQYYEYHIKVKLRKGTDDFAKLQQIATDRGGHLSFNASSLTPESEHRFVTLRKSPNLSLDEVICSFNALYFMVFASELEIIKTEEEFALYDTNVGLDDGWIGITS